MGTTEVILGGWQPRTARGEICNEASAWLKNQSAEIQNLVLEPFAPTKYGAICKLRAKRGEGKLAQFLF